MEFLLGVLGLAGVVGLGAHLVLAGQRVHEDSVVFGAGQYRRGHDAMILDRLVFDRGDVADWLEQPPAVQLSATPCHRTLKSGQWGTVENRPLQVAACLVSACSFCHASSSKRR